MPRWRMRRPLHFAPSSIFQTVNMDILPEAMRKPISPVPQSLQDSPPWSMTKTISFITASPMIRL